LCRRAYYDLVHEDTAKLDSLVKETSLLRTEERDGVRLSQAHADDGFMPPSIVCN